MEQLPLDLGDSEEENRKKRIADAKAKVKEMAEEHRATAKDERTYKKMGEPVTRGGGAIPKSNRDITKNYKAGGTVKKYETGGKVTNKELFAPLQEAFDKYEKKKADAKAKAKDERDTSRKESMTMDEMKMKSGGKVSSASKRADGCAMRGKTRGRMV